VETFYVRQISMMLALQKPLSIDGGHTAATGRGDRLAVNEILHVAAGENARNVGFGAVMSKDIAAWI
jgi:hypothetical protein